jgi:Siphovirus Gp157
MSLNLYGIESAIQECVELVESAETPAEKKAAQDALAEYVAQEIEKVDNIRSYLKHCARMADAARDEARLQAKRGEAWEERGERLRELVKLIMGQRNRKRLEGRTGTIRLQANSSCKLKVTDESLIPEEFWIVETVRNLNTGRLKAALAQGPVAGAHLEERGEHLRVV